jgi:hypothetical protein
MNKTDARTIANNGLLPTGQDARSLPQKSGREEIRQAIDTLLRLYDYDNARLELALEQLDRAAAEIERLRTALSDGWQPMATAPKDEMFIYYEKRDGKRCVGLAYRAKDGGWRDSEGDWANRINPTHWRPLPDPLKGVSS